MRVLVTGGAGFIGSHFVRRLVRGGDEVVVLDLLTYAGNPANLDGLDVELVHGDIADRAAVDRAGAGCDAVVNFAAETHVDRSVLDPSVFVRTNVNGPMTLLEWARDNDARMV
jgi:dTDP-glucose 4,6-dehydratase